MLLDKKVHFTSDVLKSCNFEGAKIHSITDRQTGNGIGNREDACSEVRVQE